MSMQMDSQQLDYVEEVIWGVSIDFLGLLVPDQGEFITTVTNQARRIKLQT